MPSTATVTQLRATGPTRWPGLLLAFGIAIVATIAGTYEPVLGGPVIAVLLGAVLSATIPALRAPRWAPGFTFAGHSVLQAAVVVFGLSLSLTQVYEIGTGSLPVMLGSLAVALVGAAVVGRLLRVDGDLALLVGVGTGICGASAIAAVTGALRPRQRDTAYAMATIFVFNVIAVVVFPLVGRDLGLSAHAFGVWAGTAVNDTSSVVATAVAFGSGAQDVALPVKLTRALMIVPVVAVVSLVAQRRRARLEASGQDSGASVAPDRSAEAQSSSASSVPSAPSAGRSRRLLSRVLSVFPAFIIGFLVAAAINTIGWVPAGWHSGLGTIGTLLISTALAGIGLGLRPAELRAAGTRPLVLGLIVWVLVAVSSLMLMRATGLLG